MKTTTIRITSELKSTLDSFKIIPRQQYEEVIWNLIEDQLVVSDDFLAELKRAEKEPTVSFDEVKKCMK